MVNPLRIVTGVAIGLVVLIGGFMFASGLVALLGREAPVVHIDPETYAKIEPGMTLQEVNSLIGGPPGWYAGGGGVKSEAPPSKGTTNWLGRHWEIQLELGQDGKVTEAHCYVVKPLP